MIKIKVLTSNTRGFLKNLFDANSKIIKFVYEENNVYEVSSKYRKLLAKIIKLKIFDYLGIFKVVKNYRIEENVCFSYNRFLDTNKPYIIFLENPSALVNYCWDRPRHYIARKKLQKYFMDENLKYIVCMSKACYDNFNNLYNNTYLNKKLIQIYPMIHDDSLYTINDIISKVHLEVIECLFISSEFNLKGGCDILKVFKILNSMGLKINLTIITRIDSLTVEEKNEIELLDNINLCEFNLSKKELDEYYKKAAIFLNPTRMDSFSLVTLESIKYGCAVISTDVYAIKEMCKDGYNGYLRKPLYPIWDQDGTLNKYYRNHMKSTVYSGKIDEQLVNWMCEKISYLNKNRDKLEMFCKNSFKLARNTEFRETEILNKWENLFRNIGEQQ